ncbi:MAG: 30S ribosome-binding factor RbfA [Alphaproteobacteria bacterium]|nr:30S ribosome-binding factor RbfA [Alphaproteobacteria bacterium]
MSKHTSPRPASQRQLRVGEELRHIVAEIFQADRLHDPDLAGRSITVTEVRVSPDLGNASVYVLPLATGGEKDDSEDAIFAALARAAPHITSLAARQLHIRRAPKLTFKRDASYDRADIIDTLLRDTRVKDL